MVSYPVPFYFFLFFLFFCCLDRRPVKKTGSSKHQKRSEESSRKDTVHFLRGPSWVQNVRTKRARTLSPGFQDPRPREGTGRLQALHQPCRTSGRWRPSTSGDPTGLRGSGEGHWTSPTRVHLSRSVRRDGHPRLTQSRKGETARTPDLASALRTGQSLGHSTWSILRSLGS